MKHDDSRPAVLVFGANGAIGAHLAQRFRDEGWQVISATRRLGKDPEGSWVAYDPFGKGHKDDCLDAYGPYDAAVWAQGANTNDSIYDLDLRQHAAIYEANCLFVVASLHLLVKRKLLRAPARLCIISSIWQTMARQNKFSYCVSKAALQGLVLSASVDLAAQGHLINAVLPGVLDTPMTHTNLKPEQVQSVSNATFFRRLTTLDDVASAVCFLCSEKNTGLTGQFIVADLGFSHVRLV